MDKFDIRYKNSMNNIDNHVESTLKTMRMIAISIAIFWFSIICGGIVAIVAYFAYAT